MSRHSNNQRTKDLRTRKLAFEQLEDRRLLAAGELDLSFGGDGFATVPGLLALDVALQPDGKIVVAGITSQVFLTTDLALARYNADGSLDSSFSGDGIVITTFSVSEFKCPIALQTDGKILVGTTLNDGDFSMLRYNADGTPDSSFGVSGVVHTNIGPGDTLDRVEDIFVQSDGKIVLVGNSFNGSSTRISAARYNSVDGSLDSTYGAGGVTVITGGLTGLIGTGAAAIQSDNKIVVIANTGGTEYAIRLTTSGNLDAFGSGGYYFFNFGGPPSAAAAVAIQPDGKIVIGGYSHSADFNVAIVRLDSFGHFDESFGTFGNLGRVITDAPGDEVLNSIALQSDGKILVGGPHGNVLGPGFLRRYATDGSLDTSFGTNGLVTFSLQTNQVAGDLAVQPDGKILLAGGLGFSVARLFGDMQTRVELVGNDLVISDVRSGGKNDKLYLSVVGGKIRIQDLNGTFITALVGTGNNTSLVEVDPALFSGKIIVNTLGGSDKLVIDSTLVALGKNVDVNGSLGVNDEISIQGSDGASTARYSPSTTTLNGNVLVNGSVNFNLTGVGTVDLFNFGTATLATPATATNQVTLTPGFDALNGVTPAWSAVTTAPSAITHFYKNGTVIVDSSATTGSDSITIGGIITTAANNANLTLKTSAAGSVTVNSAPSLASTFTVNSPTLNLNAPILAPILTGTVQTTYVAGVGQIQQAIALANAAAAVYVAPGSYVGSVTTTGKQISLVPGPTLGRVDIIGNLTLDNDDFLTLQISGGNSATQYGNLSVTGSIALGSAGLSLFGTHKPVENLTLIRNDGAAPVGGVFAAPNNVNGGNIAVNGVPMKLKYDGGDGNDVVLVDISRPVVELISKAGVLSDSAASSSTLGAVSANGRFVVFWSTAPNLVPGVQFTSGVANVFRFDRQTGQMLLVSASPDGLHAGTGDSSFPAISDDGNLVAFVSLATNLSPLKTSIAYTDVFVRNISLGQTTLLSVSSSGTTSGNNFSNSPVISGNGQVVAYISRATNLNALDTTPFFDVYAYNVANGTNTLVSINKTNNGSANADVQGPVVSANGNVIAYWSTATNLHPLDTNFVNFQDVFARNLTTNITTLVSINQAGTASPAGGSFDPAISADGNIIAFRSTATGMEPLKTGAALDILARNLTTGITKLVSVNKTNSGGGNSDSYKPAINSDGSVVAFASGANNLHASDLNALGVVDVYARNLNTNTTYLVSKGIAGTASGTGNTALSMSANGNLVAFISNATDLHPLDMNVFYDVYVRNLATDVLSLASKNSAGTAAGNSSSGVPIVSADGSAVIFDGNASNLTSLNDQNGFQDVFAYRVSTDSLELVSKRAATMPSLSAGGRSDSTAVSANGRYVAFASQATNLVAGINFLGDPIGPRFNIFRYDRLTGNTVLVSLSSDGLSSGDFDSVNPVISDDGSVVAFESNANNLHPLDNNNVQRDVFARNLNTNTTYLVSINMTGDGSGDALSFAPVISGNGNVVAFSSLASNLHPLDASGSTQDVFARNLLTGTTYLVSTNKNNNGGGDISSGADESGLNVALGFDGNIVAFTSSATNLHALDTNGSISDVFARNLATNTTTLISINKDADGSGDAFSTQPAISADGKVVAFTSAATNLHVLDTAQGADVFARNLATGETSLVSINELGNGGGDLDSFNPTVNADGTVVAFLSIATNLDPLDNNTQFTIDVFARNLASNTTYLVSVNGGGNGSGNNNSTSASISADGNSVVFLSTASNLHSVDANGTADVFIRNLANKTTRLVTMDPAGTASGNNASFDPKISADGRAIVFSSRASNLVAADFNTSQDIFLAMLPDFAPVPGDLDGSGVVDQEDYALWKANFGETVPPGTMGDANGDGVVDAADYTIWRDHLGEVVAAPGAASVASPQAVEAASPPATTSRPIAVALTTAAPKDSLPLSSLIGDPQPLSGRLAAVRVNVARDSTAKVRLRNPANRAHELALDQLCLALRHLKHNQHGSSSERSELRHEPNQPVATTDEAFKQLVDDFELE